MSDATDRSDGSEPDHGVTDNVDANRYELWRDGELVSFADYFHQDDVVVVPHVETRPDLRNQGNSELLLRGLLDDLRRRGLRIRPLCPHAALYLREHRDDQDLVA